MRIIMKIYRMLTITAIRSKNISMSLNVKPLNCEGNCWSCYEREIREIQGCEYSFEKALERLKKEIDSKNWKNSPGVHGGEPLLINPSELRQCLKIIHAGYGKSGIQTSLEKMTPDHIKIFKKYKTHVGISLDGHLVEMNEGRMDVSVSEIKRQKIIDSVFDSMDLLKNEGIKMSIIIVLRKFNARPQMISKLRNFLIYLYDTFGICDVRFNPCIVYKKERREVEELDNKQLGSALVAIAKMCFDSRVNEDPELRYLPIRDVMDMLLGYNRGTCIFGECDVWATGAETTILGDGELGNCLKSGGALDGIQNLRASTYSKERYSVLQQIDQEYNGCKNCEWWKICKGGCPGAGVDNDWRNRTRFCEGWKTLYKYVKARIKGIMPNIHTVDEFQGPANSEMCLHNLRLAGSSWERGKKKAAEEIQKASSRVIDKSRSGYTDKHGDVPHGDHLDKAK